MMKPTVPISAALTSRPADTQTKGPMSAFGWPPGSAASRKPPVRASQISQAPHTASTTAHSQGRKLGPTPP